MKLRLPRFLHAALLAAGGLGTAVGAPAAIELRAARSSPLDIEVTGKIAGAPAGTLRYLRWTDLLTLPSTELTIADEFGPGPRRLTVVFLTDFWAALPHTPDADTLFATCNDGYTSIYRTAFMRTAQPFVVVGIDGLRADHWPPPNLAYNPAPCAILVSAVVVPANATLLDAGHKKPWAVIRLELANFAEREHDSYTGRWANLSARARTGRGIWINSCASCHAGPGATFGGTKAPRGFDTLVAIAKDRPAYFKQYVRTPMSLVPEAKMEPHPNYTDSQLDALIAFITAEPAGAQGQP